MFPKKLQTYDQLKKSTLFEKQQVSKKLQNYGKITKSIFFWKKQFPNSYKLTAHLHKFAQSHTIFAQIHIKSRKNGFQIKDMGRSSCRKLRNVCLNIFYRVVLLKTPLNDAFCMEMPISRKKTITENKTFYIYPLTPISLGWAIHIP